MDVAPFRLKPWFSERVWGKRDLRPWYADTGTTEPVGEAWLTGPQCVVETGPFAGRTLASLADDLGGEHGPDDKLEVHVQLRPRVVLRTGTTADTAPLPSTTWHGMKFIAGDPMKPATNRVAGLW